MGRPILSFFLSTQAGCLCVLALVAGLSACRVDVDCFGADDCADGQLCAQGTCISPSAPTVLDVGVPDVSFPDAAVGMTPDTGPDAGFLDPPPDGGFPDTGFFSGGPTDGGDPVAATGPPAPLPGTFTDLDGVAWAGDIQSLYLCDVGTDLLLSFDPVGSSVGVARNGTGGATGVGVNRLGGLVLAERGSRRVASFDPQTTLVQPVANAFGNDRFNGPKDVEVRSDGVVYFTDPAEDIVGRPELTFSGLFRVSAMGEVALEWSAAASARPYGLALSPDERRLYMTERDSGVVRVFDIGAGGVLVNVRGFTTVPPPAGGMDTDELGNLYVAAGSGVEVFAPTGFRWGVLPVPERPIDVVFGNADLDALYVTTASQAYAYPTTIPGAVR